MTRLIISLPDEKQKIAALKQVARALGGTITKERTPAPPAKKPRTRLEREFIAAYKEAQACARGEIELPTLEEFLDGWKTEQAK